MTCEFAGVFRGLISKSGVGTIQIFSPELLQSKLHRRIGRLWLSGYGAGGGGFLGRRWFDLSCELLLACSLSVNSFKRSAASAKSLESADDVPCTSEFLSLRIRSISRISDFAYNPNDSTTRIRGTYIVCAALVRSFAAHA